MSDNMLRLERLCRRAGFTMHAGVDREGITVSVSSEGCSQAKLSHRRKNEPDSLDELAADLIDALALDGLRGMAE